METTTQAYVRVVRSFEHGGLAAFFSCATHLTSLNIVAPKMPQGAEDAVALEHIVGDHHWPNLTTLLLHNFKCREHELTTLLEKHAGTLQNLSLRNVTFLESAPRSCFEAIAGKLPQLQRVSLRGRFNAHGKFHLRHEADIHMSSVSHRARSDPQTRKFQTYSSILGILDTTNSYVYTATITKSILTHLRAASGLMTSPSTELPSRWPATTFPGLNRHDAERE